MLTLNQHTSFFSITQSAFDNLFVFNKAMEVAGVSNDGGFQWVMLVYRFRSKQRLIRRNKMTIFALMCLFTTWIFKQSAGASDNHAMCIHLIQTSRKKTLSPSAHYERTLFRWLSQVRLRFFLLIQSFKHLCSAVLLLKSIFFRLCRISHLKLSFMVFLVVYDSQSNSH